MYDFSGMLGASSRWAAALAVLVTLAWSVDADARRRTFAVAIDTEPAGAAVYLDDEQGERLGETPFRGRLEAGSYTLYLHRDGYEPVYERIEVKKRRRGRQSFSFELTRIVYGSVEVVAVEGTPKVDNARVLLDGEEIGNAPDILDKVPIGPHQVEVIKEGYEVFEAWIEVAEGETTRVEVELESDGTPVAELDDEVPDDDEDPIGGEVEASAPAGRDQAPLLLLSAGPEMGGRRFAYLDPMTSNLRPYQAFGVPMLRLRGELYPLGRLHDNPFVTGWGVVGEYAQAAPLQSATESDLTLDTAWNDFYVGGRFRLALGNAHLGFDAGVGAQNFNFDPGMDAGKQMLAEEVPDVSYRFTRFGGDVGGVFAERWRAHASFDYRLVSELGVLQTRFLSTQVSAFGGGLGLAYLLTDEWDLRLNGHYNRYALTFSYGETGEYRANGGIDEFFGAMLGVGYRR